MTADLSIIITNHNKTPEQLTQCIDSIKEQTVLPKEVILVDDGSDDPRAHAYATSIILPKNVGVCQARDIGVKMSTGKLILFVDADDYLSPDFIEQCGKVIGKYDIAYPNMLLFGEGFFNKLVSQATILKPKHLVNRKCAIPVTSMMHRTVYELLGGFRELPVFEDWDFWVRAMAQGFRFARANTLLYYRQAENSRNRQSQKVKEEVYSQITKPYQIVGGKLCLKGV